MDGYEIDTKLQTYTHMRAHTHINTFMISHHNRCFDNTWYAYENMRKETNLQNTKIKLTPVIPPNLKVNAGQTTETLFIPFYPHSLLSPLDAVTIFNMGIFPSLLFV